VKADAVGMKILLIPVLLAAVSLLTGSEASAQYKAPSQYFPKNRPVPGAPGGQPPAAPGGQPPATPRQAPAGPQQPKFKDLPVNSQFYFTTDTNRTYAWTKTSDTTAKNTKNGVAQTINGETPIQR
jgi:hypothetical protein